MVVAFHASSTGTVHLPAGPVTVTVTKPTVSAGDVLVVEFGTNGSVSAGTMSAPAGWTLVGSRITSTKVATHVWWALQSVASTDFTYNEGSGSDDLSWTCLSFSGVDNTTPIDAAGTGNSNTAASSITPANYTSVTDGALPLVAITDWNAGGVFTSTGYTVVPSSAANCQTAMLYRNTTVSPAGTVTGVSIADSAGASGNILCYQQFALRPAAADTSSEYGYRIRLPHNRVGPPALRLLTRRPIYLQPPTDRGLTFSIGQCTETDFNQTFSHSKIKEFIQTTETDLSETITQIKKQTLSQPFEIDTTQSFTRLKVKSFGLNIETDLNESFVHSKVKSIGQQTEINLAQVLTHKKLQTLSIVTEIDTLQTFTHFKVESFGLNVETDLSESFTHIKTNIIGQSNETGLSQLLVHSKLLAFGITTETDSSQTFTKSKIKIVGLNQEIDLVFGIVRYGTPIGISTEIDTPNSFVHGILNNVNQTNETDIDFSLQGIKNKMFSLISETNISQLFGHSKLKGFGFNTEVDASQHISLFKSVVFGPVIETDESLLFSYYMVHVISQLQEIDSSLVITVFAPSVIHFGETLYGSLDTSTIYGDITIDTILGSIDTPTIYGD